MAPIDKSKTRAGLQASLWPPLTNRKQGLVYEHHYGPQWRITARACFTNIMTPKTWMNARNVDESRFVFLALFASIRSLSKWEYKCETKSTRNMSSQMHIHTVFSTTICKLHYEQCTAVPGRRFWKPRSTEGGNGYSNISSTTICLKSKLAVILNDTQMNILLALLVASDPHKKCGDRGAYSRARLLVKPYCTCAERHRHWN